MLSSRVQCATNEVAFAVLALAEVAQRSEYLAESTMLHAVE